MTQTNPTPNTATPTWELVMKDMAAHTSEWAGDNGWLLPISFARAIEQAHGII